MHCGVVKAQEEYDGVIQSSSTDRFAAPPNLPLGNMGVRCATDARFATP